MQITPIDPQIAARHRRERRGQGQLPIKTKTSVGAFREIEGQPPEDSVVWQPKIGN